jgi:hypothetical protein
MTTRLGERRVDARIRKQREEGSGVVAMERCRLHGVVRVPIRYTVEISGVPHSAKGKSQIQRRIHIS